MNEDVLKKKDTTKAKEETYKAVKSKTPLPKNPSKKKKKKIGLKITPLKKDYQKQLKRNSNDFQDPSSSLIVRLKNRGSRSVELFNSHETKRVPVQKSVNISNSLKNKSAKKTGKIWKSRKLKKKSMSPSECRKEKNLKDLIDIQNLLKNYQIAKRKKKNEKKKLESENNEKKAIKFREKNRLDFEIERIEQEEQQKQIKIENWLNREQSKLSESLDMLSDVHPGNIVDESEVIAKNFSFINTENLQENLKIIEKSDVLERKFSKSFGFSQKEIQIIPYEAEFEELSKGNPAFVIQRQGQVSVTPCFRVLSIEQSSIQILPKKRVLSLSRQKAVSLPSASLSLVFQPIMSHMSRLSILTSQNTKIPTSSNTQILVDQVSEELTNNINSLFIIEQLRNLEQLSQKTIEHLLPKDCSFRLKEFTDFKYSTVLNFLQPGIEHRISQFLSILSTAETSVFLQKSQKKKEIIKELLNEIPVLNIDDSESSTDEQLKLFDLPKYRPEKTEPLMNLDLKLVEFGKAEKQTMDNEVLLEYLGRVVEELGETVLFDLQNPLSKNPLLELDKIQDLQIGTVVEKEISSFKPVFDYQKMLKIELLCNSSETKDKELEKIEKFFKKMILDNINFFIQQCRPFGCKGKPLPWEKKKEFDSGLVSFEELKEKLVSDFEFYLQFRIGRHEEAISEDSQMTKAHLTESQINKLLVFEIPSEEEKWTDYTFEETQVKIDLSDVLLYELVLEVININDN